MSFCYHICNGRLCSHKISTDLFSYFLSHILFLYNLESKVLEKYIIYSNLKYSIGFCSCFIFYMYQLFFLNMKRQKKRRALNLFFKCIFMKEKSCLEELKGKNHSIWLFFNMSKYINSLLKCRSLSRWTIFLFLGAYLESSLIYFITEVPSGVGLACSFLFY